MKAGDRDFNRFREKLPPSPGKKREQIPDLSNHNGGDDKMVVEKRRLRWTSLSHLILHLEIMKACANLTILKYEAL
jgi:hypothetical protein